MSKRPEKLTEKERRFVEAFMGEAAGNATLAHKLAGYNGTDGTHRAEASKLLAKPNIAAAVLERQQGDPLIATREERQRFWTAILRGDMAEDGFDTKDRLKASELLGKASGDYLERLANPDGSALQMPALTVVVKP